MQKVYLLKSFGNLKAFSSANKLATYIRANYKNGKISTTFSPATQLDINSMGTDELAECIRLSWRLNILTEPDNFLKSVEVLEVQ